MKIADNIRNLCNTLHLRLSAAVHGAICCGFCLQSKSSLGFSLKPKKKKATYRKREGREEQYALSRFDPVLLDVLEDALSNKLNQDEYPFVR